MKRNFRILVLAGMGLSSSAGFAQGATCAEMEPICTDSGAFFTAGVGSFSEPGNDYGCLFTTPDPSWYYLEIATAGDINMELSAPEDIDCIIWGPFADLATAISYCGSLGTVPEAPEVDCSYLPDAIEYPDIPSCLPGEVYILLITNYAGIVQDVSLVQIGGTGSTDCSIVVPPAPCDSDPGTFNLFKNGVAATSPIQLCEGDDFDIISNDDFILPTDTIAEPLGDGVYTADLLWLVYDSPPVSSTTDPSIDPGYLDYIFAGEDASDINDATSDIVNTLGCGTYYFVPVAGDDGIGLNGGIIGPNDNGSLHWDLDNNNCFLLGTPVVVTYACPIDIDIVDVNGPSCNGMEDGTATITADVENGTITSIEWTSPSSDVYPGDETNTDMTGMEPGTWTVCVEDNIGCEVCVDVNVPNVGSLTLSVVTSNEPSCNGFTDGSITVDATGGTLPYDYGWIPTNPVPGATYNNLGAGTYTSYVEDANGCKDTIVITLGEPGPLTGDLTIYGLACYGDQDASVVVDTMYNAQGDLTNISYFWNPNPSGVGGVGADSAYNMSAGTYTITVNDDNGCVWVYDFVITEPNELVFAEIGYEPAYCRLFPYQSGNGVVFAAASGGTPDYTYEWTEIATGDTWPNTTWGGLNPGDYEISLVDDAGCVLTQIVTVDSLSPIAEFTMSSPQFEGDYFGTLVMDIHFVNQSLYFANPNDPLADTTFFWNFDDQGGWIITHDYYEEFDRSYGVAGTYNICLVAQNKNGCTDTTCKELIVYDPIAFEGVNVFTPNGDGINDVFTFNERAKSIETFHCLIVDRWGTKKHEMDAITDEWNGTDRTGSMCKDGVYFYTWEAVSFNGTQLSGQGNVQLLSVP